MLQSILNKLKKPWGATKREVEYFRMTYSPAGVFRREIFLRKRSWITFLNIPLIPKSEVLIQTANEEYRKV